MVLCIHIYVCAPGCVHECEHAQNIRLQCGVSVCVRGEMHECVDLRRVPINAKMTALCLCAWCKEVTTHQFPFVTLATDSTFVESHPVPFAQMRQSATLSGHEHDRHPEGITSAEESPNHYECGSETDCDT